MAELDLKALKSVVEYYRRLLLQHLELVNQNQQFSHEIQKMQEILSKFQAVEDVVPLSDPALREAVSTTQAQLSPRHAKKPNMEAATHILPLTPTHLDRHVKNVSHRLESLETEHRLATAESAALERIILSSTPESPTKISTPLSVPIPEMSATIRRLEQHFHHLMKTYEVTTHELKELQYYWEALTYQLMQMGQDKLDNIFLLNLRHVDKVLEREVAQLIMSWRELAELAAKFTEEYTSEAKLELEKVLQQQVTAAREAQVNITPKIYPLPGGRSKETKEQE